jgi:hypothetical protein
MPLLHRRWLLLCLLLLLTNQVYSRTKTPSIFYALTFGLGQVYSTDSDLPQSSASNIFIARLERAKAMGMPFTQYMPLYYPYIEYQREDLYSHNKFIANHLFLGMSIALPRIQFSAPFLEGACGVDLQITSQPIPVCKLAAGFSLYLGDFSFEQSFKDSGSTFKLLARMRFVLYRKRAEVLASK